MTTNVPSPTFGPNGFQAPTEEAINVGTTADIVAAFAVQGLNINPSPATSQGQAAASEAAVVGNVNNLFLLFTNLVDPALSSGRMQDAIARIYFLARIPSSPTVVQCLCTGSGATIPAGAIAQGNDGSTFICQEAGTLPVSGGSITLPFANQAYGAIPCAANNVQTIFQAIGGWDAIDNPTAGVTGLNVETPQQFEARRYQSVAHNSRGWLAAVIGAVLSVPGVIDAFATENASASSQTIGGAILLPFSIYVAVVGGDPQAVAEAVWLTKGPGSLYNGNTTETVFDKNPLYTPPFPSYPVSYEIPTPLPFTFSVTMANNSLTPSNALALVQTAILNAFAGLDGGPRARIGSTVYASRFYAGISQAWTGATIVEILLGTPNDSSAAQFTGSITSSVLTVSTVVSGAISQGMSLFDATGNITPGTTITGGGGTTWNLSAPQTVALEAMTGVLPASFSEQVNINQVPVVTAANITLTLV